MAAKTAIQAWDRHFSTPGVNSHAIAPNTQTCLRPKTPNPPKLRAISPYNRLDLTAPLWCLTNMVPSTVQVVQTRSAPTMRREFSLLLKASVVILIAGVAWSATRMSPTPIEATAETPPAKPGQLLAGVARIDITGKGDLPPGDTLYAKALVLKQGDTMAVIVTVDAVAIGEIGPIRNDYLAKVRAGLTKDLGIAPERVMINASHCHGIVCADVDEKTIQVVKEAAKAMVPVRTGVGTGLENRIQENRRLKLKNGREADVRHAYSLPADDEVVGMGPIDPQVGVLKLDKIDGKTLAVIYNFACHPIMGLPGGGNTADYVGYASKTIENNLSDGALALFIQGCGGDINPLRYKDVNQPRDAEPLGNLLGLTVLKTLRSIVCTDDGRLTLLRQVMRLPRADNKARIEDLEQEQERLVKSLRGTTLNLKTFLPLVVKYQLDPNFPANYSHAYMSDKAAGRNNLEKLDEANRAAIKSYIDNILTMEQLTRLQTNLALLRRHHEAGLKAGTDTLDAEVLAWRIGNFVMVTFPGEVTVEIGLNIKKASPHKPTFVAGYTNGYLYYSPTAEQLKNIGGAQEDSDCRLAPAWQKLFEDQVAVMLSRL